VLEHVGADYHIKNAVRKWKAPRVRLVHLGYTSSTIQLYTGTCEHQGRPVDGVQANARG
jgi:hypothetical protein